MKGNIILLMLLTSFNALPNDPDPKIVNSTGGILINTTMTIEYSLGEMAISTITGTNGILTEGYLQPVKNTITVLETEKVENSISIYPNPVIDLLFFTTSPGIVKEATIYSIEGRKIITFDYPKASINLDCLSSGTYTVEFTGTNGQLLSSKHLITKQ